MTHLWLIDQATGQKYYLERQQYVLGQMLRWNIVIPGLGMINQNIVDQAEALTTKMKFPPVHPSLLSWLPTLRQLGYLTTYSSTGQCFLHRRL